MTDIDPFLTYPVGAVFSRPPEQREHYLNLVGTLSITLKTLISSPKTSAFIRGIARTYNIPPEQAPHVAFQIFRVAIGELSLVQLSGALASALEQFADQTKKIASEIERELFAPVMLELNQYLAQQKSPAPPAATPSAGGARNVLDLKSQPRPPLPPPIPKR